MQRKLRWVRVEANLEESEGEFLARYKFEDQLPETKEAPSENGSFLERLLHAELSGAGTLALLPALSWEAPGFLEKRSAVGSSGLFRHEPCCWPQVR